jgi:signal transduction histidine kinase
VSGATLMINTIAALFIAYTFQPIKKYFDVLATRLLIKDYYDYEAFINEINDIIVNNADIKTLLNLVTSSINKNLSIDFADFYIEGNEAIEDHIIGENKKVFISKEWREIQNKLDSSKDKVIINIEDNDNLEKNALESNIGLIVKLLVNDELLGYLVLGQKKSGNNYTSKDIRAIEIIADEMAIAVQNMLRYDEIAKFNITLQQKIDNATKELQDTNEKLRSLDEAKDEFISMASHQLRTPLTSVKGYISMLLEGDAGDLNDTQKKFLDQAFISSQRMVYLIADLLNVSRLKTGKFVIEAKPTYLPDVVESEISQLYETAKVRELELVYKKPSSFVTLNLDETKTRQVIMNFVDNAIYYTPRGGKIKVELKQLKDSVEYTVTDNGIGVPKKEQHHLFTKFYRAGNAKKSRPDGTGLGLYMAKKVIIAQGGHIIFKTQEGKGSTFGFSFPINKDNSEDSKSSE